MDKTGPHEEPIDPDFQGPAFESPQKNYTKLTE